MTKLSFQINEKVISKDIFTFKDTTHAKFFEDGNLICEANVFLSTSSRNVKIFLLQNDLPVPPNSQISKKIPRKGALIVENDQVSHSKYLSEVPWEHQNNSNYFAKIEYDHNIDISVYINFMCSYVSSSIVETIIFHSMKVLKKRNEKLFIPKNLSQLSQNITQIIASSKNLEFQKKCLDLLHLENCNSKLLQENIDLLLVDWMKRTNEKDE